MSPIWGTIAGGVTLGMMLTFIAVWIWAWLPGHAAKFDALARLPMQETAGPPRTEEQQP